MALYDNHNWKTISEESVGLDPSIESLEQYQDKILENLDRAFSQIGSFPYSREDLERTHKTLFEGIFQHAGQPTKTIRAFGNFLGVDPAYYKDEMNLLSQQTKELWNEAKSTNSKLDVLSFFQTRSVAIHGFEDGNGRLNRFIMEAGISEITGKKMNLASFERSFYMNANNSAMNYNNLTDSANMVRCLGNRTLYHEHYLASPFRIVPMRERAQYNRGLDYSRFGKSFIEQEQSEAIQARFLQNLVKGDFKEGRSFYKNEDEITQMVSQAKEVILTPEQAVKTLHDIANKSVERKWFWQGQADTTDINNRAGKNLFKTFKNAGIVKNEEDFSKALKNSEYLSKIKKASIASAIPKIQKLQETKIDSPKLGNSVSRKI